MSQPDHPETSPTRTVSAEDAAAIGYRRTVWIIAAGTLAFALCEALWAHVIGSADLIKDASGFGYDIALNVVAASVFGRGARIESLSALVIGGLLAATGIDGLIDFWTEVQNSTVESMEEVVTSNGVATAVSCLAMAALMRFRDDENPLIKATWLNARNDAVAALLTSGLSVFAHLAPVRWPEYALDLIAVIFSFQAAYTVLRTSWPDIRAALPERAAVARVFRSGS
ncbi:cation transporter [Methylobacterium sp. 77]|uniref:cation transporter n=1 Tax=Methylobacterium sp. 77 TaxID=1101192 RepID=UPI000372791D|nr:cation transporter [Methylobacterium sp. 77]